MVEQLAGLVVPERDISMLVTNPETGKPITPVTLRKHFPDELKKGHAKIRVRHHMALLKAIESGNVTAMIWFDKTRYGIREKSTIEIPGAAASNALPAPGEPVTHITGDNANPEQLNVARRIAYVLSMGASMPKPTKEPAEGQKQAKAQRKARQPA